MATTVEAIKDALYDWTKLIAGNTYDVGFENEDLPDTKEPKVDLLLAVTSLSPNPTVTTIVPDATEEVPNPDGVEHIISECAIDVTVTVFDKAAMDMAHKLISSLKSRNRFKLQPAPGLWQIMGLGGVISPPTDLSALETGATLQRVEFKVKFHTEVDYTFVGDYIKTTVATVKEGEKGVVATLTLGTNPHPIPEECN
jgi:hypothetical protein